MLAACTQTVSILYAIVFGAGDACVSVGAASLFSAFAVFMVGVIILQFGARKLWRQVAHPAPPPPSRRIGTIMDAEPEHAAGKSVDLKGRNESHG